MSYSTLLVEVDSEGIAVVTINRPTKLNALNAEVLADLDDWFTAAATDSAVKGIILTGAGPKAFVAGADISQFKELGPCRRESVCRLRARGIQQN